jgi:hypothetical protein
MRFIVDVMVPKDATAEQRDHIAAYLMNFVAHATIQSCLADLDAPF